MLPLLLADSIHIAQDFPEFSEKLALFQPLYFSHLRNNSALFSLLALAACLKLEKKCFEQFFYLGFIILTALQWPCSFDPL